jgi:hypothetical protein
MNQQERERIAKRRMVMLALVALGFVGGFIGYGVLLAHLFAQ